MSECNHVTCEEEAAAAYNLDYCSSTCEILSLRKQLRSKDKALEDICALITGHKKTSYYILNECRDLARAAKT